MLAGLTVRNKTVGEVLPLIAARGVKVAAYYDSADGPEYDDIGKPADGWYVHSVSSFAPGEVLLWTGAAPEK
jgi:hypothetical protein